MDKIANPSYYLGVDVGGSKTQALIADGLGQALGAGKTGPGNWEGVGYEGFRAAVSAAVKQALGQAGIGLQDITAAGLGIAGYDWPSQRQPHLDSLAEIGFAMPFEIVNDSVIGLLAGTTEGWGVAVVGGTGNNCRGLDRQGREGRITGNGTWFGEFGGGGEVVVRAMQKVSYEWTKRGPKTTLTGVFLALSGAKDTADLIEGIVTGKYHPNASWAPAVFEAAYAGDPQAVEVIEWTGKELGQLACAVIRQLELEDAPVEVVQMGSLFNGGPMLTEPMRQTIQAVAPKAKIVRLDVPPVVGAVLLGMEQVVGREAYRFRGTLLDTTRALVVTDQK
jgi:N-acetylglucosamine kinase-like BadF-type ATPase